MINNQRSSPWWRCIFKTFYAAIERCLKMLLWENKVVVEPMMKNIGLKIYVSKTHKKNFESPCECCNIWNIQFTKMYIIITFIFSILIYHNIYQLIYVPSKNYYFVKYSFSTTNSYNSALLVSFFHLSNYL